MVHVYSPRAHFYAARATRVPRPPIELKFHAHVEAGRVRMAGHRAAIRRFSIIIACTMVERAAV